MLKLMQVCVFLQLVFLLCCLVNIFRSLKCSLIMPGFFPSGTGESQLSSSVRAREQRTTTRTRDTGHNKNMKQAFLEEGLQRDGESKYCSEEMSVECIRGNLSMSSASQPDIRGREVERNQKFTWEPWRSKQSSATGNQSAMAKWSNGRAGRQRWEQAEVSNTTPATHKELWEATGWPEARMRGERRPAGSSLLPMNVEMNHDEIFCGNKMRFCMAVKGAFR